MIVVSDTSPLNYLILAGCVDLLPSVFGQVVTAPAVLKELSHKRSPEPVKSWAASPPAWLTVQEPTNPSTGSTLGPGESAAIALAEEIHATWLLIDERDGREEASRRGLNVVGTLAVLDRAATLQLVDLPKVVEQLKATNFFVAEKLWEELLARDVERKAALKPEGEQKSQGPKPQP